jgi:hypothetical protein
MRTSVDATAARRFAFLSVGCFKFGGLQPHILSAGYRVIAACRRFDSFLAKQLVTVKKDGAIFSHELSSVTNSTQHFFYSTSSRVQQNTQCEIASMITHEREKMMKDKPR